MAKPAGLEKTTGLARRLATFIVERHPLACALVLEAFDASGGGRIPLDEAAIERRRPVFVHELSRRLEATPLPPDLPEPTPRTTAATRMHQAHVELLDACDGFLRREAIERSLSRDERLEILRGMLLTRAIDNRLKMLFTSGDVHYGDTPFQGKGFRSLGQEAIYAAAIRLRRGAAYRQDERWQGDVVGPVIRDLGVALAMRPEPATI